MHKKEYLHHLPRPLLSVTDRQTDTGQLLVSCENYLLVHITMETLDFINEHSYIVMVIMRERREFDHLSLSKTSLH